MNINNDLDHLNQLITSLLYLINSWKNVTQVMETLIFFIDLKN